MIRSQTERIVLQFQRPAGTSRGILTHKKSWIIQIWDTRHPSVKGIGEASIIEGLSPEWTAQYEAQLDNITRHIEAYSANHLSLLKEYPSIRFGVEAALKDLETGGRRVYFDTDFTRGERGIFINGLIWMGSPSFLLEQIKTKLEHGYRCLKLKIGAIDFHEENQLLRAIRRQFSPQDLELRVDANGAFSPLDALEKINRLSEWSIHSIEQPILPGQLQEMGRLCENTPIPIALDEELIGICDFDKKEQLLTTIQPHYIILKPSLIGGFQASDEWIQLAERKKIGWWITSALESNVGLTAIAQYSSSKNNPMAQGLGTGQLFVNNLPSRLSIQGDRLFHRT